MLAPFPLCKAGACRRSLQYSGAAPPGISAKLGGCAPCMPGGAEGIALLATLVVYFTGSMVLHVS